ncbi:hypothetical protein COV94_03360, partial [Candidatus Woesearchaeota archaeon CG11_big_fil_rev_8_21_14_0_20_57_5]
DGQGYQRADPDLSVAQALELCNIPEHYKLLLSHPERLGTSPVSQLAFTRYEGSGSILLAKALARTLAPVATIGLPGMGIQCQTLTELLDCVPKMNGIIFLGAVPHFAGDNESPDFYRAAQLFLRIKRESRHRGIPLFVVQSEQMVISGDESVPFDLPSRSQRLRYLRLFHPQLSARQASLLVNAADEQSYDALDRVIFQASLYADAITAKTLRKAMHEIFGVPDDFDMLRDIKQGLSDLIGKKDVLRAVRRICVLRKESVRAQALGIRTSCFFLFHGPAGTGKTFTARAIAGELKSPLVLLKSDKLKQYPLVVLRRVISLVETHPNAIVFIDEAEKLFGNHRYGEDTFLVGDFQELLDSAFKRSFKGTLILSMNEPQRFNPAFRDRFVEIEFPLPTHEERVQYLTEKTR